MPCSLKRENVSEIVLDVFRQELNEPSITESSRFGKEIVIDDIAKGMFYYPIKMGIERVGCFIKKFSPSKCRKAKAVKDIVDAVWDDLKPAGSRTKSPKSVKKEGL